MRKYTIAEILLILITVGVCMIFSSSAIADHGKRDKRYKRGHKIERKYEKHPPGHAHGYRHKYYGHRHYHPRHYHGHWRSWRAWEDYHHHHRREIKRKRYYKQDNSLYVEIETDEGRFVFSIGR